MPQRITQVDAFTAEPFRGNPAAVCIMETPADSEWMQAVAREMNLSETAFVHPHGDAFDLRWFTPAVEVALCGHATLASAHVLWEEGHLERDRRRRHACFWKTQVVGDWLWTVHRITDRGLYALGQERGQRARNSRFGL